METRKLVYVLTGVAVSLIVVIGGLVLLVSGGGGDDDGSSSDSSPTLPARQQGELRVRGADPITLDPACASDADSASYIVELFSGLVSFDKDLKLIPDIADHWDVSDDGTVYTFHLRTTVLFADNSRRVTADDFKYSMERSLNPDTQSTVGDVYLDDLAGADDFIAGRADSVSGIKVLDPDTLELTIKAPDPVFLDKLTYPTSFVVDKNQVKDANCSDASWTFRANGTGPFKLANWDLGNQIVLEPNPNYYLDPKPALSRVTFLISGGSSFTMYQNDEVDVTGVGKDNVDTVRDTTNPLNAEYHTTPSLSVSYIGFNVNKAPFDDPNVRKALAMAIDKDFLANNLYKQLLDPAGGIVPPDMPGYDSTVDPIKYDPTAAKTLLDSTGKANDLNGVKILTAGQGAAPDDVLEAVTAMWQQNLGVSIEVEQEDFGLFLSDVDQGSFEMFSLGWVADYPDAQNFLDLNFHTGNSNNKTGYSNSEVDQLLDQARTDIPEAQRNDLYHQAEQTIVDDEPWIPLFFARSSYLVKPYVTGYDVPAFVIPTLRYVTVNK